MLKKIDEIKAPFHLNIEITGQCQLDCIYCYCDRSNNYISLNDFKRVIDEVIALDIFEISIGGGEPFLHPDFIEMMDYLAVKATYQQIGIVSNGMNINENVAKKLGQLLRDKNHAIQISCDSSDDEINKQVRKNSSLIQIFKGIQLLQQNGLNAKVGTVITNKNYNQLYSSTKTLYEELKVIYFHFMHLEIPNHKSKKRLLSYALNKEQLDEVEKQLIKLKKDFPQLVINDSLGVSDKSPSILEQTIKGVGCTAGVTHCEISPELEVLPCGIANQISMGSLKKSSFSKIWKSSKAKAIRMCSEKLCDKIDLNKCYM